MTRWTETDKAGGYGTAMPGEGKSAVARYAASSIKMQDASA